MVFTGSAGIRSPVVFAGVALRLRSACRGSFDRGGEIALAAIPETRDNGRCHTRNKAF